MNKLFNVLPLLVLVVLGVFGVKGIVQGTGNSQQGIGNSQQGIGNREQGTGNSKRSTANSQLCEVIKGSIYDGDTLKVSCNGAIAKVRLACIDAPEAKQQGGIESRDFLRNLINKNGSEIALIPLEQDRYGRTVAELILKPGSDQEVSIQEEILKAGSAMVYEQYASSCPNISAFRLAQEIAQKGKKGVWAESNPEPPWIWRKQNK